MALSNTQAELDALLEDLAALEHERWAHWQRYMHDQGQRLPDGSLVIPVELVRRWDRQIDCAYEQLSEAEKESDRQQVRRYLPIVLARLGRD